MGVGVYLSGAIQLVELNDKPTPWASECTGQGRVDPKRYVLSGVCGGHGGVPWSPMTP